MFCLNGFIFSFFHFQTGSAGTKEGGKAETQELQMPRTAESLVAYIRSTDHEKRTLTPGACCDYGLDYFCPNPRAALACWTIGVLANEITADQMHAALKSNKKKSAALNDLLASAPSVKESDSFKSLMESGGIRTAWDGM
jgi:hypothetical protein